MTVTFETHWFYNQRGFAISYFHVHYQITNIHPKITE